jgi:RecJ-like exonuclease
MRTCITALDELMHISIVSVLGNMMNRATTACSACDGTGRVVVWACNGRELYEHQIEACSECRDGRPWCTDCYRAVAVLELGDERLCRECARYAASIADTLRAPAVAT